MYYSLATKETHSALKEKNGLIASLIPSSNPQGNNCIDCIPGWLTSKDAFLLYCILCIILKFTKFWGLQNIGSNYNSSL